MKQTKLSFILVLMVLLLTSCSLLDATMVENIDPPKLTVSPINGKWHVESGISLVDGVESKSLGNGYIGQEVLFDISGIVLVDEYIIQPGFNIKNVNGARFVREKYDANPSKIAFLNKDVDIISVFDNEVLNYDIIMETEDVCYIYDSNILYKLVKDVDEISEKEVKERINEKIALAQLIDSESKNNNALLLGFKTYSYDERNNLPNWKYSTLFIDFSRNTVNNVYVIDDMLVPKTSGFWSLIPSRQNNSKIIEDRFIMVPANKNISLVTTGEMESDSYVEEVDGTNIKNIQYINPNYMSIEETVNTKDNEKKMLRVYNLDDLPLEKPLKLSQFIKNGEKLYADSLKINNILESDYDTDEKNVGIYRTNGNWGIKGRVNYLENSINQNKDFQIIPKLPNEYTKLENHNISIEEVKKVIPKFDDVFISPNGQNIIVLNGDEISIHARVDGSIRPNSYYSLKLEPNTTPIMSEWTEGKGIDNWRIELNNIGASKIK